MTDNATPLPIIESCDGCGSCCLEQESPPLYHMILHDPRPLGRPGTRRRRGPRPRPAQTHQTGTTRLRGNLRTHTRSSEPRRLSLAGRGDPAVQALRPATVDLSRVRDRQRGLPRLAQGVPTCQILAERHCRPAASYGADSRLISGRAQRAEDVQRHRLHRRTLPHQTCPHKDHKFGFKTSPRQWNKCHAAQPHSLCPTPHLQKFSPEL